METKQIYKSLADIMLEITHIGKTKTNTQQNFKYRGIDDIMNELHSLFAKNSVIILPITKDIRQDERQSSKGSILIYTKLTVRYDFISCVDGSFVSTEAIGEAMDSGDKSTNKAMSVALKYVLLQMFLIPTEDMTDPDATTYEVKAKQTEDILKKAIRESKECKDMSELTMVWNRYPEYHSNEDLKKQFSLMRANITKNQK